MGHALGPDRNRQQPCRFYDSPARERTLTDAELKAIWKATDDGADYSGIVRLCILSGCRRDEIGRLRRDEIQGESIVVRADRMKGGVAHEIPLSPRMAEQLPQIADGDEGEFMFGRFDTGFSGWSKCKRALDARLASAVKMRPWTLHDLRRTFSTRLHDAGVEPIVIEALLAHKQQGVAAVYNRASFRAAKKAALERWHDLLRNILGQPRSPHRLLPSGFYFYATFALPWCNPQEILIFLAWRLLHPYGRRSYFGVTLEWRGCP
jgi:integrase